MGFESRTPTRAAIKAGLFVISILLLLPAVALAGLFLVFAWFEF